MTATSKLTPAQITLLRAVSDGKVQHLGGAAFYGTVDGRWRKLTARVRTLDDLGLIDPAGMAMKRGEPMPPEEQFPDYYVVALTPAGQQALADAGDSQSTQHDGPDGQGTGSTPAPGAHNPHHHVNRELPMSDKTGPLTLREFEALANLLRRFEVNHTGNQPKIVRAIAADTFLAVRRVYCDLYVPDGAAPEGTEAHRRQEFAEAVARAERRAEQDAANDPLVRLLDTTPVPMTAGPNPIPVSELLNQADSGIAPWHS